MNPSTDLKTDKDDRKHPVKATLFFTRSQERERRNTMLRWALAFLIIAVIAAFLGFSGVEFVSVEIARIIFFVFLVLLVVSLITGLARSRPLP